MLAQTIPKIFFNSWFWFAIAIPVAITLHLIRKKYPPPFPKVRSFFFKHKKTIHKIADIFLISVVLFQWIPILYMFASIGVKSILLNRTYNVEPLSESLRFALAFFLNHAIHISGISVGLIGLLSVFQSNITKAKRIILLIISLLPIMFTTLLLLTNHIEKPEDIRLIIKFGLGSLATCWVINGPAIITGKHFFRVSWSLLRKLRLVSGDYPE